MPVLGDEVECLKIPESVGLHKRDPFNWFTASTGDQLVSDILNRTPVKNWLLKVYVSFDLKRTNVTITARFRLIAHHLSQQLLQITTGGYYLYRKQKPMLIRNITQNPNY